MSIFLDYSCFFVYTIILTYHNHPHFRFAYTFDAGPHATIFTLEHDVDTLLMGLRTEFGHFPMGQGDGKDGLLKFAVLSKVGGGSSKL